jgi:hypothetical protein
VRRANLGNLLATIALLAAALPGCETLPQCPPGACEEEKVGCPEIPACSRNRTFIFLIDGLDPLCQMDVLRERLIECGFIKVYSGPRPLSKHYAREIQRLHQDDPDARFVLVSQGSAAGAARAIAERAGTPIDLIVLLDDSGKGPAHAESVLLVCGEKDEVKDESVAQVTIRLADAGPLGVAKHPQTAKLIVAQLCAVAGKIPVIEQGPRCDLPDGPPCGEGWDFLRPDGHDTGCIGCKPMVLAGEASPATAVAPPEKPAPPKTLPPAPKEKAAAPVAKPAPSNRPVALPPPPPTRLPPPQP